MLLDAIIVHERIVDIKQKDDVVPFGHVRSSLGQSFSSLSLSSRGAPPQFQRQRLGLCRIVSAPRAGRSNPVAVGSRAFDDAIARI
jgi:hypothetical protein